MSFFMESLRNRGRLGKQSKDATSPRPIKICFNNSKAKAQLYRQRHKMVINGEKVYVGHDLTKTQQQKRKANVAVYK